MCANVSLLLNISRAKQDQEVRETQLPLDPYDMTISETFPPHSLNADEKISLGIRYLEQHAISRFPFFQRVYRLTRDECAEIFSQSKNYVDDSVTWEPLEDKSLSQEVALIRATYPQAIFYLLTINKENTRTQPIVDIDGKRYYFYSQAYKGPVVDKQYIQAFAEAQIGENRPQFLVLPGEGISVFLMEFHGTCNPEFRELDEIRQLIDLIVQFSLCRKGLDMLPSRLAFDNGKLYCVDQKLNYGIYQSSWEAFQANINALKGKIESRRYPEQDELFQWIDQIAATYSIPLFLKTIEGKYTCQIPEIIPLNSLNKEQRVDLTAAVLMRNGTKELAYMAREYHLSCAEQQESMRRAGEEMQHNIVTWDTEIMGSDLELKEEAERAGIRGEYKMFCNRIGNFKSVLTVDIDGQVYVVRKADSQYVQEYLQRKQREHRPDFLTFPAYSEKSVIILTQFMGVQPIDYLNFSHLQMIVDLSDTFAGEDRSTIDFNRGNLIVSGNRLFFIDKDLRYDEDDNPRLRHFKNIFDEIKANLFTEKEQKLAQR